MTIRVDASLIADVDTLAERFSVESATIHTWRRRHPEFPEPAGRVGGRPWWWWPEVEKWGRRTGRLEVTR